MYKQWDIYHLTYRRSLHKIEKRFGLSDLFFLGFCCLLIYQYTPLCPKLDPINYCFFSVRNCSNVEMIIDSFFSPKKAKNGDAGVAPIGDRLKPPPSQTTVTTKTRWEQLFMLPYWKLLRYHMFFELSFHTYMPKAANLQFQNMTIYKFLEMPDKDSIFQPLIQGNVLSQNLSFFHLFFQHHRQWRPQRQSPEAGCDVI